MDEEILEAVQSMLGNDVEILDYESTSTVREEEVLLINGIPIKLDDGAKDVEAIREALITGQVPNCDIINHLLYRAGILRQSVKLETSLSVKASTVRTEEVVVLRDGKVQDERCRQTNEDNYYTSSCHEVWEPTTPKVGKMEEPIAEPQQLPTVTESTETDNFHIPISSFTSHKPPVIPARRVRPIPDGVTETNSILATETSKNSNEKHNSNATSQRDDLGLENDESLAATITTKNRLTLNLMDFQSLSLVDSGNNLLAEENDEEDDEEEEDSCTSASTLRGGGLDSGIDEVEHVSNSAGCLMSEKNLVDEYYSDGQCLTSASSASLKRKQMAPTKPNLSTTTTTSLSKESSTCSKTARKTPTTSTATTNDENNLKNYENEILKKSTNDSKLVYNATDGSLESGTLDALIEHMMPSIDYYPTQSFLFAFLLSARLFIAPHELLDYVVAQYEKQTCNSGAETGATTASADNTADSTADDVLRRQKIARSFVRLLAEWMETFPYDFRDDRLMQRVRHFLTSICSVRNESNLKRDVSRVLKTLLCRLSVLDKYEEFLYCLHQTDRGSSSQQWDHTSSSPSLASSSNLTQNFCSGSDQPDFISSTAAATSGSTLTTPTLSSSCLLQQQQQSTNVYNSSTESPANFSSSTTAANNVAVQNQNAHYHAHHAINHQISTTTIDISELCPNPLQLAHQLTHIELERLSHIGPEEFVQAFAKDAAASQNVAMTASAQQKKGGFCDVKKTRNLESYVQWFNRLSYLVATEIVKHPKKKQRVRIVEYWIETARECFNIGNFNSLMAIIAGLNMSSISRLKKTWAKVQLAKFSVLEHQMDPSSNFNSYRSTLKAAQWRAEGATDERERIVIPFFSLLIKDLYFLNEGCSNRLPNGHINFEKFWQLAKQVAEVMQWKQVICPFEKQQKIIMFLQTNHILTENALAKASFECEPPENTCEKDRYKILKNEF